MRHGEMYDFSDPEIKSSLLHAKNVCRQLQTMTITDSDYRATIRNLIPSIPDTSIVCPPFHCDHGSGIILGEHVFVNYNCVFLDGANIHIGANSLIGPNCQLYTPQHPIDYVSRRLPQETAYSINIGEDCWLGGNVTICPGVTIGDRCIIAAGSVVIRDIPSDSMAAGNPAKVKKHLNNK